nr:MAG TPA: hypothetical protein [Caudoviricetes sp.]
MELYIFIKILTFATLNLLLNKPRKYCTCGVFLFLI